MTSAEYHALSAPKSTGKGNTRAKAPDAAARTPAPKADHSGELTDPRMQAVRREVVGVGRYAGYYSGFGIVQPYRRYVLLNDEQADELDRQFHIITGTQPT